MKNDTSIWRLLNFDKGDIFSYLIFGVAVTYIWKTSNISSIYILPFILLCIFIYLRQDYFHRTNLLIDHKIEQIKNDLLNNKYPNLMTDNDLLLFLDSIVIYKKYSPEVFSEFLDICEKYYIIKDIYNCIRCIEKFESFNYLIPIQMLKNHYLKKKEFAIILKRSLEEPKRKMVEMQSFLLYNLTNNNLYNTNIF